MRDPHRDLVSRYLAGQISIDELGKSLVRQVRTASDPAASDVAWRLLAVVREYRVGLLSEAEVRLALVPEATWARTAETVGAADATAGAETVREVDALTAPASR